MSLKKTIVKNISLVAFSEVLSSILSYVLIVLVARLLGPEELGIYSFTFAFAGIFTFLYDFGISYFYITKVSQDRANARKYFGQYASLKLVFCILTMIAPMVAILFTGQEKGVMLLVFLAAVSLFFQNYSYVARNTYYAYQQMKYEAGVRIMERIIAFGLGVTVLLQGHGLFAFLVVLVLSNFFSVVLSIYFLRKLAVPFSLVVNVPTWKMMVRTSWPLWLSTVFLTVYFQVDTVMISFIQGHEATGIYNAAYKLINVFSKIPWIIILVLFPVMAEAHAKMSKELLRGILEKGIQIMVLVGIPLVVGITAIAGNVISLVYGTGFSGAVLVLQILVWATAFLFLGNMAGWFFNSIGKPKVFTWVTGVCLSLNLALNLVLIPKFSYLGAAVATVSTAFLNCVLLLWAIKKEGYSLTLFHLSVKPLFASLVMGVVAIALRDVLHVFLLVPIAMTVYVAVLIMVKGIRREDIEGMA
ncbi:flippase [Candidatus Woesearchaeota archaeon]|nr:flippase [Candidatus Woesearchaeota archaeon]